MRYLCARKVTHGRLGWIGVATEGDLQFFSWVGQWRTVQKVSTVGRSLLGGERYAIESSDEEHLTRLLWRILHAEVRDLVVHSHIRRTLMVVTALFILP